MITLPWPHKDLSPNVRIHWTKRAKAVGAYRRECMVLARIAGLSVDWDGWIYLWATFYPPDRRRYDDDGIFSRFKAGRDGLADALGIDDHRFCYRPRLCREARKGGAVVVSLTQWER